MFTFSFFFFFPELFTFSWYLVNTELVLKFERAKLTMLRVSVKLLSYAHVFYFSGDFVNKKLVRGKKLAMLMCTVCYLCCALLIYVTMWFCNYPTNLLNFCWSVFLTVLASQERLGEWLFWLNPGIFTCSNLRIVLKTHKAELVGFCWCNQQEMVLPCLFWFSISFFLFSVPI